MQAGTILWGIDDVHEGAGVGVAVLFMGVDVVTIRGISIAVPLTSIEIAVLLTSIEIMVLLISIEIAVLLTTINIPVFLLRHDSPIAMKLVCTTCFIIHS